MIALQQEGTVKQHHCYMAEQSSVIRKEKDMLCYYYALWDSA